MRALEGDVWEGWVRRVDNEDSGRPRVGFEIKSDQVAVGNVHRNRRTAADHGAGSKRG
jgi:hypothetical protein